MRSDAPSAEGNETMRWVRPVVGRWQTQRIRAEVVFRPRTYHSPPSRFAIELWELCRRFGIDEFLPATANPFQKADGLLPFELTSNVVTIDPQQLWADYDRRQAEAKKP